MTLDCSNFNLKVFNLSKRSSSPNFFLYKTKNIHSWSLKLSTIQSSWSLGSITPISLHWKSWKLEKSVVNTSCQSSSYFIRGGPYLVNSNRLHGKSVLLIVCLQCIYYLVTVGVLKLHNQNHLILTLNTVWTHYFETIILRHKNQTIISKRKKY